MRNNLYKIATAALAITLTLLSCSGSEDNPGGSSSGSNNVWNGEPIKKAKISGVSQKGPFIRGSEATLYELNSDLSQTGKNFQDIIADDKGSFEIKGIELVSPYALLKADGFYRNEVTGQISNSKITLYAIADVTEKSSVNVNILTHLEYRRVMKLAEGGMSIIDAKKQAQREILSVFSISGDFADSEDMSIFGTSEGDGALLAISILLQRDLNEGNFTATLSDFNLGFAANGTWDNEEAKAAMADWAYGADLEWIRNKIMDWGLSSSVPDFEKYIYDYFVNIKCSKKSCFTDVRDGQKYSFVKIGEQTWMAENLSYNASGSKCFNNRESYCTNGMTYNWETALKACPEGWHLPSNEELDALTNYVESDKSCTSCAAKYLKAENDNGLDSYGFAGNGSSSWWSATEYLASYAYWWYMELDYVQQVAGERSYNFLRRVRCLQD